jgi:hypothetical protein
MEFSLAQIPCPVALTHLPHYWSFVRVRCRQRISPPPQAIALLKSRNNALLRCSNWLCGLLQRSCWKKSKQILPFLPPLPPHPTPSPPSFLGPPPLPAPAIPRGSADGKRHEHAPTRASHQALPPDAPPPCEPIGAYPFGAVAAPLPPPRPTVGKCSYVVWCRPRLPNGG